MKKVILDDSIAQINNRPEEYFGEKQAIRFENTDTGVSYTIKWSSSGDLTIYKVGGHNTQLKISPQTSNKIIIE